MTVIVGANDAGKTFVLDGIDAALRDDASWWYSASLEVFFRAHRAEIQTSDATLQVQHDHPGELWLFGHEVPPDELPAELIELLVRSGSNEHGDLAVITTPSENLERPIWLCAAPWSMLDRRLRSALRTAWPQGARVAEERPWRPLPVDCIAEAGIGAVLEPVRVPAPAAVVEADVGAAVVALTRALRLLPTRASGDREPDDVWSPLEGLPVEPLSTTAATEPPGSTVVMLREGQNLTALSETAVMVCHVFDSLINETLPAFIASRYRLQVVAKTVTEIARGGSIAIALEDRRSGLRFPLARAAAGYGLWLQLALREANARLRWYAHIIDRGGERLHNLDAYLGEDEWRAIQEADELRGALATILGLLRNPEHLTRDAAETLVDPRYYLVDHESHPSSGLMFDPPRQRLYLLDEPEQRLHPALQRRAAAWLAELMDAWGAQCVLATHALAFINVDADLRLYQIVREEQGAALCAVDPAALGPHDQLARELGFDRGEMLSRWRAFLFVEGQGDVAVIEELYGDRLRRGAIMLSQVLGHRNHAGLVEIQLLTEGLATPVAALFDGVSAAEIVRIRTDAQYRSTLFIVDDERATVARIAQAELAHDRQIELLTIGKADIFDVLSEDVIRAMYPDFPGHAEAKAAFAEAGGGNASCRKEFYRRRYHVPISPHSLRNIARQMREQAIVADPLEEQICRVELLALTADSD